jgi:hypothetical protein
MAKHVVLWISQKKAIIVSITDGAEKVLRVESNDNGRVKEEPKHHPGEYYRRVTRAIQDAQEIFIFGSAQAKMELKIAILKVDTLAHRVIGTETVNTMTENQLVARAREICQSRAV